ncbi:MAG: glycosyltransferase family 9 protein [Xanthomonadales bacterium]|nr:glycosyltransferase family 9 protein [Xanthomonadales bacterium]
MVQSNLPSVQPASICLLRLSALGDVTHVVPLVRALQAHWPQTQLTWIVGKFERKLVGDIAGVEFVDFDKKQGWRALRTLRTSLRGRRFDALLHLQVALRANLASAMVPARRRIGYDRQRARDGHGLFINERIEPAPGQHVQDALRSFLVPLGVPAMPPSWNIPIPDEARAFAEAHLPGEQPTLLISPCSSHVLRNWNAEGYACVADYAQQRHGYRVVLCGGPSALERSMGDRILAAAKRPILDLIGKDTIKQLLALLQRATVVLTPDSGPMHMANAVGTRVVGLHAASNPQRSGPYSNRSFCVDRYDDAARTFLGKPAAQLPWGKKIEFAGVMDLISTDDVIQAFERHASLG